MLNKKRPVFLAVLSVSVTLLSTLAISCPDSDARGGRGGGLGGGRAAGAGRARAAGLGGRMQGLGNRAGSFGNKSGFGGQGGQNESNWTRSNSSMQADRSAKLKQIQENRSRLQNGDFSGLSGDWRGRAGGEGSGRQAANSGPGSSLDSHNKGVWQSQHQGATRRGGEYDRSKTVTAGQGEGYGKQVNMTGTTANGGQYDRSKTVTAGQGEGYNKQVETSGTTASGRDYDVTKTVTGKPGEGIDRSFSSNHSSGGSASRTGEPDVVEAADEI
ncbi:MAG: hypothetical protein IPM23_12875 [Candidatus Melainabacteria bacterium]|nr:hypothetical protein [Candidatus Melainabacteria bacterium]